MTVNATNDVYFDPYDVDINADPYPAFARLREQAPLYYNDQHDFYALSRYDDVTRGIVDHGLFSSARGAILEEILKRFPEWEVDLAGAVFSTTSTIRGWDSMPAFIG